MILARFLQKGMILFIYETTVMGHADGISRSGALESSL